MEIKPTPIFDCHILNGFYLTDIRGHFFKTFQLSKFEKNNIFSHFKESFFSKSIKNVIRGMHLQANPHSQHKLLSVLSGKVLDVIFDVRKNSPTFKKSFQLEMTCENGIQLLLPPGVAHGFLTISDHSLMSYQVSEEYAPDHDVGFNWNTIEINWGIQKPILSERDANLPKLTDFLNTNYF